MEKQNSIAPKELLRSLGQKATPGRVALLEVLEKSPKPLSISGISKALKNTLDQTTLYRALETLTEKGAVRRVDFQHDHVHYELVAGKKHHHHLICQSCGAVEDIERCITEELTEELLKKSKLFASIETHSLEFYGLCNRCIKK